MCVFDVSRVGLLCVSHVCVFRVCRVCVPTHPGGLYICMCVCVCVQHTLQLIHCHTATHTATHTAKQTALHTTTHTATRTRTKEDCILHVCLCVQHTLQHTHCHTATHTETHTATHTATHIHKQADCMFAVKRAICAYHFWECECRVLQCELQYVLQYALQCVLQRV